MDEPSEPFGAVVFVERMEAGTVVVIVLVLAMAIVVGILVDRAGKAEIARLSAWAAAQGLTYYPDSFRADEGNWYRVLEFTTGNDLLAQCFGYLETLSPMGQGHSRWISNVFAGNREGVAYAFFDYEYKTGSGDDETRYCYGMMAALLPIQMADLRIRPQGFMDSIGAALGIKDIQFESDEFNRMYFVTCSDQKFAYDILHPQMMDALLRCEPIDWQFMGQILQLHQGSSYREEAILTAMSSVHSFLRMVPGYVWKDAGLEPPDK